MHFKHFLQCIDMDIAILTPKKIDYPIEFKKIRHHYHRVVSCTWLNGRQDFIPSNLKAFCFISKSLLPSVLITLEKSITYIRVCGRANNPVKSGERFTSYFGLSQLRRAVQV